MKAFMNAFELGVGDVSVDLGSSDVGMAEQSLHTAQVGAVLE